MSMVLVLKMADILVLRKQRVRNFRLTAWSANLRRKMAKDLWTDAILMHKSAVPGHKVDVDF
jgi:hypothetical protein